MKKETLDARFWRKVDKSSECWLWTAGLFPNGYGCIWHDGRSRGAHCVAWELQHGPIPEGLCVLHHCDVKNCVRGYHLFVGTEQDNSQDMAAKRRGGPQKYPWLWANEQSANHKLTLAQVEQIRAVQKVRRQPSDEKLAKQFGVARGTINRIRGGRSWNYVSYNKPNAD